MLLQKETLVDVRRRQGPEAEALGTSRALEKQYLRLTSAPTTDTVRPPVVLEAALQRLKDKWLQVCHVSWWIEFHLSRIFLILNVWFHLEEYRQEVEACAAGLMTTGHDRVVLMLQGVSYEYACDQLKSMRQAR